MLGFGTWTAFGAGKVLVGLDSADTLFDTLEETGGSKDAVTVSHTHTATSTDSGHTHSFASALDFRGAGVGNLGTYGGAGTTASSTANITTTVASAGESGTNKNIQPYIVVNMWKRTA